MLAVNKTNTRYYPGPNLGQARELLGKLDNAQEAVGYTRFEKSSKNFKPISPATRLTLGLVYGYPEQFTTALMY